MKTKIEFSQKTIDINYASIKTEIEHFVADYLMEKYHIFYWHLTNECREEILENILQEFSK